MSLLSELVLHPRTAKQLTQITHNLPHALIIGGSIGVGVAQAAKAIAQAVGSPEFVVLPKKKSNTEFVVDMDEGSTVIGDIRLLYVQTRTKQPGKQVYIIDTGRKSMTVGAQNALLKLLEEPRNDVHFIIATHSVDQLLPTIASRCQQLTLRDITGEQTAEYIKELGVTDVTMSRRLAFVGRGRPALIKRLATDKELYDARVTIMSDAKVILAGNHYEKIIALQKYRESRSDSLTLLGDMIYQLQIVLKSNPDRRLVADIEGYLKSSDRINAGGNVRLQLTAGVL